MKFCSNVNYFVQYLPKYGTYSFLPRLEVSFLKKCYQSSICLPDPHVSGEDSRQGNYLHIYDM